MKIFNVLILLLIIILKLSNCVRIQLQTINTKNISINPNLVEVKKGCIVLFSECDFNGQKKEICENQNDLRKLNFDRKISSILVGGETSTILKKGYNFRGMGVEIKHNVRCFDKRFSQFRNNISSLVISQLKK
jgi:hypothetical protein